MARVLVTRRLPGGLDPLVEAGHELIEPDGERSFTHHELVGMAPEVDALVCLLTDKIDAGVLAAGASFTPTAKQKQWIGAWLLTGRRLCTRSGGMCTRSPCLISRSSPSIIMIPRPEVT